MAEELKKMMKGVSKGIVDESTEPYLEFEKLFLGMEGYIKGIRGDTTYGDSKYGEKFKDGYKNGEMYNDDVYNKDDKINNEYIQGKVDIEKEDEKIKKKNKWLTSS